MKKFLSVFFSAIFLLNLFVPLSYAETNDASVFVAGTNVASDKTTYWLCDENGMIFSNGASETNYNVKFETASSTQTAILTLNEATIAISYLNSYTNCGIYIEIPITIDIIGENAIVLPASNEVVSSDFTHGILHSDSLTFSGNGSLDIEGCVEVHQSDSGIYIEDSYKTKIIEDVSVNISSNNHSVAFYGDRLIICDNATISVNNLGKGDHEYSNYSTGIHIFNLEMYNNSSLSATASDASESIAIDCISNIVLNNDAKIYAKSGKSSRTHSDVATITAKSLSMNNNSNINVICLDQSHDTALCLDKEFNLNDNSKANLEGELFAMGCSLFAKNNSELYIVASRPAEELNEYTIYSSEGSYGALVSKLTVFDNAKLTFIGNNAGLVMEYKEYPVRFDHSFKGNIYYNTKPTNEGAKKWNKNENLHCYDSNYKYLCIDGTDKSANALGGIFDAISNFFASIIQFFKNLFS